MFHYQSNERKTILAIACLIIAIIAAFNGAWAVMAGFLLIALLVEILCF